jgi:acyl-CoA thioester hydrolase
MTAAARKTAPLPAQAHVFPVTVYWEDTDAGGVVYYANYLCYAERGRTELLRTLGVNQRALVETEGFNFVVRRLAVDYIAPARLEDVLEIVTVVRTVTGASVEMEQVIRRGGDVLVRMDVTLACINARGRATRLPADIARAFAQASSGSAPRPHGRNAH